MVFFPCVVVQDLFDRLFLALGEYVADVIKPRGEAGVDLYFLNRGGGLVVWS